MFITFEGVEGAGKSTLIKNVKNYLEKKGFEVVLSFEPGATQLGKQIREFIFENKLPEVGELLMFFLDRYLDINEIILPAVKEGKIVLVDRFVDSTFAYQCFARGLEFDFVKKMHEKLIGVWPDRTYLLDLDPQQGLDRIQRRLILDRIEKEKLEFHQRVRNGFLKLADIFRERIKVIDASLSKEKVFELVRDDLDRLLGEKL